MGHPLDCITTESIVMHLEISCQERSWKIATFLLQSATMTKDAALVFRIPADLKRRLLRAAKREARSLSQVCEMLLMVGVQEYEKSGPKYLQKTLPDGDETSQR